MKLDLNQPISGKVAIVGAGPSDPELMTLRAVRLLGRADVVLVDALVDSRVLTFCPDARVIDVGKRPGGRATGQEVINALLVKEAKSGNFVVRLKGGDPFVFGRGGEEALALAEQGIDFEIVPGISSSVAAPQAAGIPVTHRGVTTHFSVVAGHGAGGVDALRPAWRDLAKAGGTLVVLMGVKNLPHIVEAVMEGGRDPLTPCAIVHRGTTEDQYVVEAPLAQLVDVAHAAQVASPATIVIGEVVNLRQFIASSEFDHAHQEVG